MADSWFQLSVGDVNSDEATSLADTAESATSAISSLLQLVRVALQVASAFAVSDINAAQNTLDAVVATVENTFLDLLQNNAGLAVHANVNWDPDWTYEDFLEDSRTPWRGTNTTGWLADILGSTFDESDPFRPLSDEDTQVSGFIVLKGVPANADPAVLLLLLDAFGNYDDFKALVDVQGKLVESTLLDRQLFRLGPAALDPFYTAGLRAPDQVLAGLQGFAEVENYVPVSGAYPKWVSVPFAAVFPPLYELFNLLWATTANLRQTEGAVAFVNQLINLIDRRIELLQQAATQIDTVVEQIEAILSVFTDSYILLLEGSDTGGIDQFIQRALNAADLPDFGPNGIVVGAVLLATYDEPKNHLENLLQFIGLTTSDYVDEATTRAQALTDQYADVRAQFNP